MSRASKTVWAVVSRPGVEALRVEEVRLLATMVGERFNRRTEWKPAGGFKGRVLYHDEDRARAESRLTYLCLDNVEKATTAVRKAEVELQNATNRLYNAQHFLAVTEAQARASGVPLAPQEPQTVPVDRYRQLSEALASAHDPTEGTMTP